MNVLDLLLLGLLVLAGFVGYRRGFTLQAFGFGGLLVGLVVGALLAPFAAGVVESPWAKAAVAALVLLAAAGIGNGIGWYAGAHARTRTKATRFGQADAVAGSTVAVVASLVAIWFLALNLVNGPFLRVSEQIRGSAVVRTLDAALPEPPSLLAQARHLLNRFGFPDVFAGIPPLPAEPVTPPTQAEAHAAFEAGATSTVRVIGEACGRIQEGSAFVVADGFVVTNAHVVAGMDDPRVESPGASIEASTVLFDPDLDLAVLRVDGPTGPVLALATGTLDRGATGAVLGYPAGGPLDARRAAVRRTIPAIGRDIYGDDRVERLVVELQTEVRPGNSGGPFILSDGRVGGVVFAASSSDEKVGYAIAAPEVEDAVSDALVASADAPTGPCIE